MSNGTEDDFRRFLRLDEPMDLGANLTAICPEWKGPTQRLTGFRLLRPSDPVEALFCFLCTSNNHLPRIKAMCQTLAQYGRHMAKAPGWAPCRFPEIERLAELEEGELRAQGFGYRAKTIPLAARQILERGGLDWLLSLKTQPYDSVHQELTELAGVGPKLADCIALYALHHTSAVPVDTHLWQATCALWFPDWKSKSLTLPRYRQIGEAYRQTFGPWAAHAHLFLYFDHLQQGRQRAPKKSVS